MFLFVTASGVFEGSDGGNRLPREFLDQDKFNISNGYFTKKQKL
jgi:hypothetical protein